jgi:hypothetical protein
MKDKLCIGIAKMSKQHGNIPREKLTKIERKLYYL